LLKDLSIAKNTAAVNILLKFKVMWSTSLIHCSVVLCCDLLKSQTDLH
jgi:hypothetical protein